jgi:hypothetical protein
MPIVENQESYCYNNCRVAAETVRRAGGWSFGLGGQGKGGASMPGRSQNRWEPE